MNSRPAPPRPPPPPTFHRRIPLWGATFLSDPVLGSAFADPVLGSTFTDPTLGSHVRIPHLDLTLGSHVGIPRLDPTFGSHVWIPRLDPTSGSHVWIPRSDPTPTGGSSGSCSQWAASAHAPSFTDAGVRKPSNRTETSRKSKRSMPFQPQLSTSVLLIYSSLAHISLLTVHATPSRATSPPIPRHLSSPRAISPPISHHLAPISTRAISHASRSSSLSHPI